MDLNIKILIRNSCLRKVFKGSLFLIADNFKMICYFFKIFVALLI